MPLTLNALQIEDELISFGSVEDKGEQMLLKGCKRGAWGTTAAAHDVKQPLINCGIILIRPCFRILLYRMLSPIVWLRL